jgi:hypothetical protein
MTREERAYNYASKKNPSKFTVSEIAKHYDDGYADGYKDAIDKACEWLEKNACNYEYSGGTCDSWFSASDLVESFRKYMEE